MRPAINMIRKILALFSTVLFIASAPPLLLLAGLPHTVLNPAMYKRLLVERGAYEQIPALAAEQIPLLAASLGDPCAEDPFRCAAEGSAPGLRACITGSIGEAAFIEIASGGRPASRQESRRINACIREGRREARLEHPGLGGELAPLLNDFSSRQWEAFLRILFPPASLQRLTESALDDLSAYLDGESDSLAVSLAEVKARLAGEAGEDFIVFLLNLEPPCTAAQIAQINAGNFENGGAPAIYCAASGETLARMVPGMQQRLDRVVAQLPDEVAVIDPVARGSRGLPGDDPWIAVRTLRNWMRAGPLVLLALFGLAALGVQSLRGWLRRGGTLLLTGGLLGLAEAFAVTPLLDWVWTEHILLGLPAVISPGFRELGYGLMHSATGELARWVMLEAGVLAALGLVGVMASAYLKPVHSTRS